MPPTSVVIGSPVQQTAPILEPFLRGLLEQRSPALDLSHVFLDDNHEEASSALLQRFTAAVPQVTTVEVERVHRYERDEQTHHWREDLIWRLAALKDAVIEHALEVEADYLFLVDSDVVLQPGTIEHLVGLERDVVSEVFWTRWNLAEEEMPQVWLRDTYDLAHRHRGEELSERETALRIRSFLDALREPGTYEVGGLGACTLISRSALLRGVRFAEVPNLSFWGEDRHFCIRAGALGVRLHADTHKPPLHVYRESDLDRVPAALRAGGAPFEDLVDGPVRAGV